jgi:magnesium transporter
VFGDDDTAHVTSPRGEGQTFARRRQRKLSQSNPVQRRGGKLALFEGFGNTPGAEGEDGVVVKAPRLPKNALPIGPTGGGIMPYSDNAPGHDRPYRFSFYSNAWPVTIHARTLAELPGEGQSFEDLFKGKNSAAAQQNGESVTLGGTETPKEDGAKASMLARAAGAAARAGVAVPPSMQSTPGQPAPAGMADLSPAEEDSEVFTWWLDVLSPTDEEMRMLSKVS